jgi:hypothetical protein
VGLQQPPQGSGTERRIHRVIASPQGGARRAGRFAERTRELQRKAVADYLRARGIDPEALHPLALTVLISTISRALTIEDAMGLTAGHDEALALVEEYLQKIPRPPARETE